MLMQEVKNIQKQKKKVLNKNNEEFYPNQIELSVS